MSLQPRGQDPALQTRDQSAEMPADEMDKESVAEDASNAGDRPPVQDRRAPLYPATETLLRPPIYRDPTATVEIPQVLFAGPVTATSGLSGNIGGARQPELVRAFRTPRQVPTMPPRAPTTPPSAPQRPTTAPESPRPWRLPYWLPWPFNGDSEPPPEKLEPAPAAPEPAPDTKIAPPSVAPTPQDEGPNRPDQDPRRVSPEEGGDDVQLPSPDAAADEERRKQLIEYFGERIKFYAFQNDNRGTPFTVRGTNILVRECLDVAERSYQDIFPYFGHTAGASQDGDPKGKYKKEDTLKTDDGRRRPDITLTYKNGGIEVRVYANTASTYVDGALTGREQEAMDAMAKAYIIRSLRKLRKGDSESKYRSDAQDVCRELLDEVRKKIEEYERKEREKEKEKKSDKKPKRTERDK